MEEQGRLEKRDEERGGESGAWGRMQRNVVKRGRRNKEQEAEEEQKELDQV